MDHPHARGPRPIANGLDGRENGSRTRRSPVAPVTEELEQRQKYIDEIEIEREGAEDRCFPRDARLLTGKIHFLYALGVPGREAGEYDDGDHQDHELQTMRTQ